MKLIFFNSYCNGTDLTCTNKKCAKDCVYAQWSQWSQCSKTCNVGSRYRNHTLLEPAVNGGKCDLACETEDCNIHPCPGIIFLTSAFK